jgi:sporulation protein YlmC with PRC-barrel domain
MSFKTGASAVALAVAIAAAGAAAQEAQPKQQPQPRAETPRTPVTGQILTQSEDTLLARDFIGHAVLAPDNSKVGTVNDLLLSKDGKTVEGFVVGIGGFLGIGERNVALGIDRLSITPAPDGGLKLVTAIPREELANAPVFRPRREVEAEKRQKQPGPGDDRQR